MPDAELKKKLERHSELDWLRVFAVLLLIFFHTAQIFKSGWFHLKNDTSSHIFNTFSDFIYMWHMPLFFLIAGASTWFAIEFRNEKQYRKERTNRLLIPLLFGILLVIPPQAYYENLQKMHYTGTFLEFYPHFFEGIYPKGNLHWGHLWFIFYLFIFSLVLVKPFFKWKNNNGNQFISKIADRFGRGHAIFLMVIPIVVIEIALRWLFPGFQTFFTDWANVFHYFTIFIYGFLIFADERLGKAVSRNKKLALMIGVIISIMYIMILPSSNNAFAEFLVDPSLAYLKLHPEIIILYVFRMIFQSVGEWCWLIAMLGYSKKYLSGKKEIIKYPSKIAYPFYIFHQTVIIIIGFHIVQLPINIWSKYILICVFAIPLTYLCCELMKSNKITRFMFGMK